MAAPPHAPAPRSGIYRILHVTSGRAYLGSAVNVPKRWRLHLSHLRRGIHHCPRLQRARAKHGEAAFAFEVVEQVPDLRLLLAREQAWLDVTPDKYNAAPTAGSHLGLKRSDHTRARLRAIGLGRSASEQTRERMSRAHVGLPAWNKGIPNTPQQKSRISAALRGKERPQTSASLMGHRGWNRGMVVSSETRAKLSAAGKGRPKSDEHRRKIGAAHAGRPKPYMAERNRRLAAQRRLRQLREQVSSGSIAQLRMFHE